MRKITIAAVALLGSVALAGATTLPAFAADTNATLAIEAGVLSIAAPATLTLTPALPGATSTTTVPGVAVTDLRAGIVGWGASVAMTPLTGNVTATVIPTAGATYLPAVATLTGAPTMAAIGAAVELTATAQAIQTATVADGNNTATWDSTLAIVMPTNVQADNYTAILTNSVL